MADLPVIDISALRARRPERDAVARALDAACRDVGFFYIVGHGVDERLADRLESLAAEFFALADSEKKLIGMDRGGRAWRGWFPVGGELTSGSPDRKEGIYFGAELGPDHPKVRAGVPLHGTNLFPGRPSGLGAAVRAYIEAMTGLGHVLVEGLALALGLDQDWFLSHLTADPTVLFRIFHYPPALTSPAALEEGWGVGEHTDYGLLTILRQDVTGGLEVHSARGWVDAPPLPDTFVCNLGDMLERVTGGRYRSTPHRVRNTGGVGRLSFPFFFDPSWDAEVEPITFPGRTVPGPAAGASHPRWDGVDVLDFRGTYGEYLLARVARVFPDLGSQVLGQ